MKNFFKASLLTLLMSAGICFSSESSCRYDNSIGCMICNFEKVNNEPGACRNPGISCDAQIICGGGPQQ